MHYGTRPCACDIHFTIVVYLQLTQSPPQQWPLNALCQHILLGAQLADAFHHISPSEQQNLSSRFITIGARTKYRLNTWWSHGITSCSLFSCQALIVALLKEILMLYLMFSFCFLWSVFLLSNSLVRHKITFRLDLTLNEIHNQYRAWLTPCL